CARRDSNYCHHFDFW
nr:immunoglobulin heavy chain junction region [Macaca mulatta]